LALVLSKVTSFFVTRSKPCGLNRVSHIRLLSYSVLKDPVCRASQRRLTYNSIAL
jgi:hypothetical protein